jgi:catechol 2,3-dioxygenase-like lactoylglutathione lyase family enzyme
MLGMNLEHIGFNVVDPVGAAEWYCKNLGMTLARQFGPPANGRFLADKRGKMMLEFYHNAKVVVPDYRAIPPMAFHVALAVEDVAALRASLVQAGGAAEGEITVNDDGDVIAMVRDPWGLTLQLLKRAKPML